MHSLSRFNFYLYNYPNEDNVLIYNLFTKAFLPLSYQDFDKLKENIQSTYTDMALNAGVLVESKQIEFSNYLKWCENHFFSSTKLDITLMLTYDCNSKCIYCYEKHVNKSAYIDISKSDQISDWILRYYKKNQLSEIDLCFHGGEPLLNFNILTHIGRNLRDVLGDKLKLSIVTNGTLLQNIDIEKLEEIGISTIQITIDGVGVNHNKCRPIIDENRNSYCEILEGYELVKNKFDVVININLSTANIETIESDLEHILCSVINSRTKVIISNIRDLSPGSSSALEDDENVKVRNKLYRLLQKYNHQYAIFDALSNSICCMMSPHAYVISPHGNIQQCISAVEYQDFVISDLNNAPLERIFSVAGENANKFWKNRECVKCNFLSVCMGRCHFERYLAGNKFECKKKYFQKLSEEIIKIKFQEETKRMLFEYSS